MTPERPASLWQAIAATAAKDPARIAVTFLDAQLSATDYTAERLLARAQEIGARLAALDLDRARPLGVLVDRLEDQILHYLAALSCGLKPAILTPPNRKLDRDYYLRTTRSTLETCRFCAVISDVAGLELSSTAVLEPHTLVARPAAAPAADATPAGEIAGSIAAAAFLQFSSGTTGMKKGVAVSDAAVLDQIDAYASAIALAPDDVIVSWLPLYHDMGFITALNMPLVTGTHVVMLHPIDWVTNPALYVQAVARYRGTLGWHPNFAYAFMADRIQDKALTGVDLASLRGLVNCSEPATKESQDRFATRFALHGLKPHVFWGCLAMAETTFALTHGRDGEPGSLDPVGPVGASVRLPMVSVGTPIAGVRLRVVDADADVLERHVGELWVQSPFNLFGYYNNPEATEAALRDGWYRTGDLGYRVGEHYFVCGRKKDLLIVGGVNVHPQDLENAVSEVDKVIPGRTVAFAGFDAATQTERVVILAESRATEAERLAVVIEIRKRIVAMFQIANCEVHLVPPQWLVKSSAGKIARSENRSKWERSGTAATS